MAKKTINIGTSANKGNGDPLRTAFDKINSNFNELYAASTLDPENTASNLVPATDNTYNLGSASKQWSDLHIKDFIYINGSRLSVSATGSLLVGNKPPSFTSDIVGSVFADDSTLLVDGVNGVIPGYISIASLKTEVAASTDFADFKTRIAAL